MSRRPPARDPQWQLTHAAKNGDLSTVRVAMARGADVNFDNGIALVNAASNGHAHIVRALIDDYHADLHLDDDLALRRAVAMKHVLVAKILLQRGANPNANGGQALISAATWNLHAVVDMLLTAGADVHAQGDLALLRACYYNGRESLQLLLERGADVMAAAKIVDDKTVNRQMITAAISAERSLFDGRFADAADKTAYLASSAKNLRGFDMGETNLIRAARMDRLDDAIRAWTAPFTEDMLFGMKDRKGHTLADYLDQAGLLTSIFVLSRWDGDITGMTKAWDRCRKTMSPQRQKDYAHVAADIERQVSAHRREQLRRKAPKPPGI